MANPVLRDWKMHGLLPVILRSRLFRPVVTHLLRGDLLPQLRVKRDGVARSAGDEVPDRCMDLPGNHLRNTAGSHCRNGTHRGGSALFSRPSAM